MAVDSLPLPPPQVPLVRPDGSGKNTQQGFEFLDRLQRLTKALAAVTNIFDNLTSGAADTLLQSLLNDNYETLGVMRGITDRTNSTLQLADAGALVYAVSGSACTITVPPVSSVAWPFKTYVNILQEGAGQLTLTPGSGVTLLAYNSGLKLSGRYALATIFYTGADSWRCGGNLTP